MASEEKSLKGNFKAENNCSIISFPILKVKKAFHDKAFFLIL